MRAQSGALGKQAKAVFRRRAAAVKRTLFIGHCPNSARDSEPDGRESRKAGVLLKLLLGGAAAKPTVLPSQRRITEERCACVSARILQGISAVHRLRRQGMRIENKENTETAEYQDHGDGHRTKGNSTVGGVTWGRGRISNLHFTRFTRNWQIH